MDALIKSIRPNKPADGKLPEARPGELDPADFKQSVHDRVERHLHDFLRLQLRLSDTVGNLFDDLFLGHGSDPPRTIASGSKYPQWNVSNVKSV